ncbi:MAG TPA: hypothetical protein VF077_08915 [Nitrospiraceae bacterium]
MSTAMKTPTMKHDYPANDSGVRVRIRAKVIEDYTRPIDDGVVTLELPATPVQLWFETPPKVMTPNGPRELSRDEETHFDMAMQKFHKLQLASLIADLMEDA